MGDVAQAGRGVTGRRRGVERGLQQPQGSAERLGEPADQGRPERRDRAGPADDLGGAVDQDLVAGAWVGVAGDVGHPPAAVTAGAGRDPGVLLPHRHREGVADPAAGGAVTAVVPDRLAGDRVGGGVELQVGAAARQGMGARGGEVDVRSLVGRPVGAAVVTRGHADRHTERGGVGERLIHRVARLPGPGILLLTPADRQRGGGGRGMGRDGDRVEETRVGVGSEVDDERGAWREGSGHLDVEQDLPVGATGILAGDVLRTVHPDRGDARRRDTQAGEVLRQVGRTEAATELHDGQALPGSVGAGWEAVGMAELQRGVGALRYGGVRDAELRSRLRPVVQAQHRGHDVGELGREHQLAGALAMGHG